MDEKKIQRINELARKKSSQGLSKAELQEQQLLYREYLAMIRMQVSNSLEEAGYKRRSTDCQSGCNHPHHHHH
ncbi:MAG TPA: DUF896 domain-containing protein [Syntrophomonadaceae bacterium]|nr:DUF896 domain-containing protein [Syntrophomonadaceae bacterium]